MIEVKNLTKVFIQKNGEELYAVNDLSFTAERGEIVVLLGVNGAGKTTAMRMLSTVLQPFSGTASVEGFDIIRNPQQVRSNLGFLSGDTGLYARLTAREVITYFGHLYDVESSDIKIRIQEISNRD